MMVKRYLLFLIVLITFINAVEVMGNVCTADEEFQVNTEIEGFRNNPDIAMDDNANFIIVWEERDDIVGQRFNKFGNKVGDEFEINDNGGARPAIAFDKGGNFIVVWSERIGNFKIFFQRFDKDANKVGDIVSVTPESRNRDDYADVAIDEQGNFVIVWESRWPGTDDYDIFALMFDQDGKRKFATTMVNTFREGSQRRPKVAMDADGNFIIIWKDDGKVLAQRFDNLGNRIGDEFTVAEHGGCSIAMHNNGDFVVTFTWVEGIRKLYAQRFDKFGRRTGDSFQVNTFNQSAPLFDSVAMDDMGNFVVIWEGKNLDNTKQGIYSQVFDHEGNKVGKETRVSGNTEYPQRWPALAMSNGAFVITWVEYKQDDSDYDILARLFRCNLERFIRGDANQDIRVDIGDAIFILNYQFAGGPAPECLDSADVNDDGRLDISDSIYLLNYIFAGGPEPKPPFPEAGVDPTEDSIKC